MIVTPRARKNDEEAYLRSQGHQPYDSCIPDIKLCSLIKPFHLMHAQNTVTVVKTINKQLFCLPLKEVLTFPTRAGIFIELVAKPMPNTIASSTPRNLATSFSSSTCLSRLPAEVSTGNLKSH